MDRRLFLQAFGFLSSLLASARNLRSVPQTAKSSSVTLSADDVRRKLADAKLYIVPYSHIDWSWAHSRQWQADRTNLVMNEVLDLLRENPDFRWFMDTQNEELQCFLDRSPDRVPELKKRVQEGKIGVSGGTIANQHPHWMEGEAFIWNMVLGRRYFQREFPGVDLSAMTLYDVTPGYSQVPQLLSKGGYRYFRTYRPEGALNAKGIPRQFLWEGLDGSTILVSRGNYGGFWSPEELPDNFQANWDRTVETFYQHVLTHIMKVDTHGFVWIANGADDIRPLRVHFLLDPAEPRLKIPEFIQEWNRREKVPLRFATPQEFFRDVEASRSRLPLIKGVLEPCGPTFWYGMSGVNGLRIWRTRSEESLIAAQQWHSLATLFGESYPQEKLESLWSDLLGAYSHAQMWLFEEDYEEKLSTVKRVATESAQLDMLGLQRLAGRVKVRAGREPLVVFNPLPWPRRDVVRLRPTFLLADTEHVIACDPLGNMLPTQLENVNSHGGSGIKEGDVWVEVTVPPCGYTTVYLEKALAKTSVKEQNQARLQIGTDTFHVRVDARGRPTLVDLAAGISLDGAGTVSYQVVKDIGPEHYGPVIQELDFEGETISLEEAGPVRWKGSATGRIGPHSLTLQIAVYPSVKRVEYKADIDSRGGDGMFVTSATLPFSGQIMAGVPFGVEPRDLSKEPYGEEALARWSAERLRRNVFYSGHWVDVSDGQRGLTIMGRKGEKGYIYYPETRRLCHYLVQTIRPVDRGWQKFCNSYMEGKGQHGVTYHLLPHAGDWKQARSHRTALEVDYPLRAVNRNRRALAAQCVLSETHGFFQCSPEHVFLSSLYRQEGKWIVRLYETFGDPAQVQLKLPTKFSAVREIDFNGRLLGKQIKLRGDEASFEVRPWEIVTLELA